MFPSSTVKTPKHLIHHAANSATDKQTWQHMTTLHSVPTVTTACTEMSCQHTLARWSCFFILRGNSAHDEVQQFLY